MTISAMLRMVQMMVFIVKILDKTIAIRMIDVRGTHSQIQTLTCLAAALSASDTSMPSTDFILGMTAISSMTRSSPFVPSAHGFPSICSGEERREGEHQSREVNVPFLVPEVSEQPPPKRKDNAA